MRLSSSAAHVVAALATIIGGCSAAFEDSKVDSGGRLPLHPITGEPALMTLRANAGNVVRLVQPDEPLAEFVAVWPDGTILWSPGHEQNGIRCLRAELPAESIRLAVDSLRTLMDDPGLTMRAFAIPDSAFDEVILFDGAHMDSMASCAHYWDSHPMAVATDHGIVASLDGDRDKLIRSRSAEFNKFLDTWTRCVTEVRKLVPSEGIPTSFPKEGWWEAKTGRCRVIEYPK